MAAGSARARSSASSAGLGLPSILAVLVGLPAWALYAAMVAVVRIGAGLPLASLELGPPWDAISAAASLVADPRRRRAGAAGCSRREPSRGAAVVRGRPSAGVAGSRTAPGRGALASQALRGRRDRARRRRSSGWPSSWRIGPTASRAWSSSTSARATAILVEGGRGGRLVVDGGPDPGRLLIALDERLPPWDRRIDVLVLTHPHEDHVAGLALLLERYRVGRRVRAGDARAGTRLRRLGAASSPTAGRRAGACDGRPADARLRSVSASCGRTPSRVPERPPTAERRINNVSIVLLGEVGRPPVPARRATSRRASTPSCSRAGCRRWTCSRSRTTGRAPRRRASSSRPSGRASPSSQRARAIPTATRRRRRSSGSASSRTDVSDRHGRHGRGRVRGRRTSRQDERAPRRGRDAPSRRTAAAAPVPAACGADVPVRDPARAP